MKTLECKNSVIYAFDKNNVPVLTLDSGETVMIETFDCFENQINRANPIDGIDWSRINPATGPIFINGAQKGDILKVTIHRIDIADEGVLVVGPNLGVMGHKISAMTQKVVPIKDGKALFNDKIQIPLNKMIGVIGVAPEGEAIPCGVPDTHGGNMDTKLINEGAILYLPIFVEGALFALGDLHAAMGDGEIGVSGLEISGKVELTLEIIKGETISQPVIENETAIIFLASKKSLDEAIKSATETAVLYLHKVLNLSLEEATMLASVAGNAEICQIVDPLLTARFVIPKYLLCAYDIEHFV